MTATLATTEAADTASINTLPLVDARARTTHAPEVIATTSTARAVVVRTLAR